MKWGVRGKRHNVHGGPTKSLSGYVIQVGMSYGSAGGGWNGTCGGAAVAKGAHAMFHRASRVGRGGLLMVGMRTRRYLFLLLSALMVAFIRGGRFCGVRFVLERLSLSVLELAGLSSVGTLPQTHHAGSARSEPSFKTFKTSSWSDFVTQSQRCSPPRLGPIFSLYKWIKANPNAA
ncbi:hypothetical protein OG21DRAFT_1198377 [Imleria badia]|nr:hypothetical protein OG21DRAFT_1198377 [Imleria badia]